MVEPVKTKARIVLAEDDVLLRAGLASLLERSGFEVVAQAGDGEELIAAVREHRPDVAIVDIRMPPAYGTEGLDAAQVIRAEFPTIGILLLSAQDSMDLLLDLPPDVRNGWSYLSKTSSTSTDTLVAAVRASAAGKTTLDSALIDRKKPRAGTAVARLTDRQYAVLRLLAQGRSNAGIGEALGITEKSVQNHINAIYGTLEIDTDPTRNPRVSAALRLLEETGRS